MTFPTRQQAQAMEKALETVSSVSGLRALEPYQGEKERPWEVSFIFPQCPSLEVFGTQVALASTMLQIKEPSWTLNPMPQRDWVSFSQKSFAPIKVGRFFVYGHHYKGPISPASIGIKLEASTAFGTGGHGTTKGCLQALDTWIDTLKENPASLKGLDMGCGTAILAIAGVKALPQMPFYAVDVDPEALEVAQENAKQNGVTKALTFLTSYGFNHPTLQKAGPFDLILANILANPLLSMAPQMKEYTRPQGTVIVSGLLAYVEDEMRNEEVEAISQKERVRQAYEAQGFKMEKAIIIEGWATLVFRNIA